MSNIFSQWQNKEISDIECIRGLNKQNRELMEFVKFIYEEGHIDDRFNKRCKDLLTHHTAEEEGK